MTLATLESRLSEVVSYDDLDKLEDQICSHCMRHTCRGCKIIAIIQDWRDYILPALK